MVWDLNLRFEFRSLFKNSNFQTLLVCEWAQLGWIEETPEALWVKIRFGLDTCRGSLLSRTDALNSGGLCSLWACEPLHPEKKRATQECLWNSHKSLPFRYRLPHPLLLLPLTYFCYDHLLLQDLHGVVASCGLLLYQDDFAKSAFSQEFEVFKVVHSLEEPEERKWHLVTDRGINKLML